jgi:hypothetical protein
MNPALVALAIQEAPAAIALIKNLFAKANPGAPELTDEEVVAAWNSAFASSLAKDDAYLAAHPQA